jgi:hypothetical protein
MWDLIAGIIGPSLIDALPRPLRIGCWTIIGLLCVALLAALLIAWLHSK